MNRFVSLSLLLALGSSACISNPALANEGATGAALGPEWIAIDAARLSQMRGGMVMPSGLAISFGIERVVYVNGQLVASARLDIPNLANMTGEQARDLAAINDGMVVRVGEGNLHAPGNLAGGLVIQNTLDGQAIQALTTLDVGVDSLATLQQLNSFDALTNGLMLASGRP